MIERGRSERERERERERRVYVCVWCVIGFCFLGCVCVLGKLEERIWIFFVWVCGESREEGERDGSD